MTAKEKLLRTLRAFSKDRSPKCNEEKGVALIFTLGILALLLVLALAFATSAMTERKAASNNNDYVVARMIAMSGVNRAVAGLRYGTTIAETFDNVFSHDNSAAGAGCIRSDDTKKIAKYDFLHHIETQIDGINYPWPSNYDVDTATALHWQYVSDGTSPSKLIGRFAYIVIPSGGRIDPSAAVDSSSHSGFLPVSQGGTPLAETSTTKKRPGVYPAEMYLGSLDAAGTYLTTPANVNAIGVVSASGTLADNGDWNDWGTFFSTLGITDLTKKLKIQDWLDVQRVADEEYFWVDSNADSLMVGTEKFDRFNLWRDWSATTVANVLAVRAAMGAGTGGLEWISNFGKTSAGADDAGMAGTFSSTAARRSQLAANLVDYCDSNSSATISDDDSNGVPDYDNPSYVGLERCPYINEVRVQFQGNVAKANLGAGSYRYTATVTIPGLDVELISMYDTGLAPWGGTMTATVLISGSYVWQPAGETVTFTDKKINVTNYSLSDQNYDYDTGPSVDISPATFFDGGNSSMSIGNLQITKLTVKLMSGSEAGDYYDFAKVETLSSSETLSAAGGAGNLYFDYAVDDPRQNLNEADWTFVGNAAATASNGTLGSKNTNVCNPNPGTGYDTETGATEPWMVSSAYIRNARIESPWELGIIHRGAKWQTLNLKCYDKSDGKDGMGGNAGGRNYTETSTGAGDGGDANILDHIKFVDGKPTYGKINLRNSGKDVLRTLLQEIYVSSGAWAAANDAKAAFDDPGIQSGTNKLDAAKANTLADRIGSYTGTNVLKNRAQIANVSALFDGTALTQDNDARKEAIIGKFINLSKAAPSDTFTIIAIGQSIRDVGTSAGITIKKDLDASGGTIGTASQSTTTSSISGVTFGDLTGVSTSATASLAETITDCKLGKYDKYADEILSEQKIVATVYRDTSVSPEVWRIIRIEYLGD